MFGIVPRPLWEKAHPPDERNRITLGLRCLLIDAGDRKVLVDVGLGDKWSDKHRAMYAIDRSRFSVDADLARAGVTREAITDVVLSHLHFDHAGGTTRRDASGKLELAFPRATWHVQQRNWDWARKPSDRDAGSYLAENFALLEDSERLNLLDGEVEILPDVDVVLSEGHTPGLQLARVHDGERCVVYCADLVPTTAHLKPHWGMAYDLNPVTVVEEKKMLLAEAIEGRWILYFEHDPRVAACTVAERDGQVVVDEVILF